MFHKKHLKRYSFFLVEIFIATMLAGLLIAAAMGLYHVCLKTSQTYAKKLDELELQVGKISRLRAILCSIRKPSGKEPFFVDQSKDSAHVYFYFFASIRAEEHASNEHMGQIYVNKDHKLIFVSSPPKKAENAQQKEETAIILFENVRSISFSFAVNEQDEKQIPQYSSLAENGLLHTWEKSWPGLPSVITATITFLDKKEPISVSAVIFSSIKPIRVK